MSPGDLALATIIAENALLALGGAALWSLFMFRDWRVTAPASRKSSAPAVAATDAPAAGAAPRSIKTGGKAA